jgi:hypothetical protein
VRPVLAISGPIVDATTNKPVIADVYVDGAMNGELNRRIP